VGVAYLIRHGEPVVRGVLLGRKDVALAPRSIEAASLEVRSVFASPLLRAQRSAELLFPNHTITILDGLAERGLGDWEGYSWGEVEGRWPELAARAELNWFLTTPPNGEPWNCFVERVGSAWSEVRRAKGPVAIVAHAGVNAVLAELITRRDLAIFRQEYLEVVTLEFES
jgi:broad specificity phosphatase PhoE